MRGALRLTIAGLAAGLLLAPAAASAQEAPTTNTPAPETVGPRELQDFNLQGNVTRPADQAPPRTPPASLSTDRPEQTPAPQARQAERQRVSDERPAPATTPPRQRQVVEAGPTSSRPNAQAPVLPPPSVSQSASAPAPSEPTSETTPPDRHLSLLPWLLAALALGGGAAFLFWRNRARPAVAAGPQMDFYSAPEPEPEPEAMPVRWLTPQPDPVPPPSSAPPAPPIPRVETPPPASFGVVSSSLRPWLELNVQPLRCSVTDSAITVEFEIELFNSGSAAARDVVIEAVLINASPNQDQDLAAFFARPPSAGATIDMIQPLTRTAFATQVVTAREHVHALAMGGHEVLVPVLAFNAFYRRGSATGQTSVGYLVGPVTRNEKLAPFRLDLGPRLFDRLGARPLPLGVRR